MSDDASLIERTLAGDTEAYGGLVCKYQDRLYTTMGHVTGSHAEAEDVVQDAVFGDEFLHSIMVWSAFPLSTEIYFCSAA